MNLEIFDLEDLAAFLVRAKRNTWAGEKGETTPEREGFKEHVFKDGDWSYRDSYTGYYCAPGQEIVRFKGQPVWSMAYDGGMDKKYFDDLEFTRKTFSFLKNALKNIKVTAPFRGPAKLEEGNWKYSSSYNGNLSRFMGTETILYDKEKVFTQAYMGGLIVAK